MKRTIALLLTAVMLLGVLPTAVVANEAVYAQSAYTTNVPLPEVVVTDLEASGTSLSNVYDFSAYNGFRSQGGVFDKAVADADSDFGKAFMFDPWANGTYNSTYSVATYGAMHFRSGANWGAGVIGTITKGSLVANANQGYHWYKVSDMEIPEKGISPYLTGVWGWSFQFNGGNAALDSLAGSTVDMYVRIKVEGDIDNKTDPSKTAKYFFDRFIFVAPCVNHFAVENWVVVSKATCTEGSVEEATCDACGAVKSRTNNDATGHDYSDFTMNPETGVNESVCANCGDKLFDLPENLVAPLPEAVMEDLNADGTGLVHIYDYDASSLNTSGSDFPKTVSDADSVTGSAVRIAAADADNPATYIGKNWGVGNNVGDTFGYLMREDMAANQGKGYQTYKIADITVPEDDCGYVYTLNWYIQNRSIASVLNNNGGHTVDLYISMKIEGEVNNTSDPEKYPVYYVDRMILVDRCTNYVTDDSYEEIKAATCTEAAVVASDCSVCGNQITVPYGDPLGHDFGEYVYNPASGWEEAPCSRCDAVGTNLPENLLARLPRSVLADMNETGTGLDHVYDFGVDDFTVGGIASVKEDEESLLGKAAVLNAWDYANPIVYMYYTNSTTHKPMPITDNTGRVLKEITAKELNVDFDEYIYRTYKLDDVTLITDEFACLSMLNGDITNAAMAEKLAHLKDEPVDLYISMKIFGNTASSSEESIGPVYYVDRMIVVDTCEDADCDCTKYEPIDCTVTFDANDGTGTMADVKVKEFDTYTLPTCGFAAPKDMSFFVWKIGKNTYMPGDTVTITGNTTVTAMWDSTKVDQAYLETFEPALRFIVASDSHIHDAWTQTEEARLEQFFTTAYDYAAEQDYQNLDGAFMVGDLTDTGTVVAHEKFFSIFNGATREGTTTGVVMGNHEYYSSNYDEEISIERFLNASGYASTDNHLVIGGYHFILVSCCGGGGRTFAYDQMQWLDAEIQKALADDPTGTKPVFLFHHQSAQNTLVGTYGEFGNWELNWVLSKYPQVVSFNGHTHDPISDPRSVWQGTFTAVGTGTLSYYGVAMGGLDASASYCPTDEEGGYAGRTIRDGSQYLIVEVDKNHAIRVQSYDLDTNSVVNKPVLIRSGDADKFIHTNDRARYATAPVFPANATVTLEEVDINLAKLRFTQAQSEEDYVANYRVDLYQGAQFVQSINRLGCYFYEPTPETLTAPFSGLEGGTTYTAKIYAVNAWGQESAPLTYEFTTKTSNIIYDEVFSLGFDENETAINTVDGTALTLDGNCYVMENFGDYAAAIASRGITMEAYGVKKSGMVMGNEDASLQLVNGVPQFTVGNVTVSAADAVDGDAHLVGTCDNETVRLYVNGREVANAVGKVIVSEKTVTVDSSLQKAEIRSSAVSAKQIGTNYEALAKDLIFRLGFDADGNALNAVDGERLTAFGTKQLPVVEKETAAFDTTNGYAYESLGNYYDAIAKAVTFEVKVTMNNLSGTVCPMSNLEGGGLGLQIVSGVPEFVVNLDGTYYKAKATKALVAGTETHIAGTYDGRYIKIYVDGAEVGSTAVSGTFKLPNTKLAYYLGIGTDAHGTSNRQVSAGFNGIVSEAKLYTCVLSAAEISVLGQPPVHTLTGYKWNKTTSQYEAVCAECGKTALKLAGVEKPLPEGVLKALLADGIGMEHVFDFGPATMQPATTNWTDYPAALVEDAESLCGQAMRLAATDATNSAKYIMTPGETIGNYMSTYGALADWTYTELKANEGTGYQLYKFEDVVYPSNYSQWFGVLGHSIRIYNKIWNASASFRGHAVDMYVSMKIEGTLETDPVYYVDRVIVVESCDCEENADTCCGYAPTKYTVSFDSNGGSGTMAAVEKLEYSYYTLPMCDFTAKNKEFVGWRVGEKDYAVGDRILITEDVTLTAQWKDTAPVILEGKLAAIEVSMDSELLLWQKFTLPAELINDDDAYAVVTADKKGGLKETIIPMTEIRAKGADKNGRYIIEQGMAAPEMGRDVTVSFVDGNGNYVNLTDYLTGEVSTSVSRTVVDYSKLALEKGNAKQKNLNKALLTYGGYAQAYFKVDVDAPVYNELAQFNMAIPDLSAITGDSITQELTSTGAALVKASSQQAFLDSSIYHQVYFTLESGVKIDDLSFVLTKRNKAGEYTEEVEPVYETAKKRYILQIDGIASPLLDYMYNVEITNANGEVQNVKTSVAAYLKLGITKSTNVAQVNMFKAMYNYNQVANTFFGF